MDYLGPAQPSPCRARGVDIKSPELRRLRNGFWQSTNAADRIGLPLPERRRRLHSAEDNRRKCGSVGREISGPSARRTASPAGGASPLG